MEFIAGQGFGGGFDRFISRGLLWFRSDCFWINFGSKIILNLSQIISVVFWLVVHL